MTTVKDSGAIGTMPLANGRAAARTMELSPQTPADIIRLPLGGAMKTLTNLMGTVVTGNELADAVVEYHDALVTRRDVALVDIPVIGEANSVRRASLAIGWLTELVSASRP